MPASATLQEYSEPFVATYDPVNRKFTILDAWNDALKNLDVEDDIPDDHPAITHVSESAFMAMIKEAEKHKIMSKILNLSLPSADDTEELKQQIQDLLDIIEAKNEKLATLLEEKEEWSTRSTVDVDATSSDEYKLKKHLIDKMTALVASGDIAKLA